MTAESRLDQASYSTFWPVVFGGRLGKVSSQHTLAGVKARTGCRLGQVGLSYPPIHMRAGAESGVGYLRLGCSTCWHAQDPGLEVGLVGDLLGYSTSWQVPGLGDSHVSLDHSTLW